MSSHSASFPSHTRIVHQGAGAGFATYIYNDYRAADIILFDGTGDWTSTIIKLGTCPPIYWPIFHLIEPHYRWISHVGICFDYHGRTLLGESTTLNDTPCEITGKRIKGVQAHFPVTRISSYTGNVWRMRLRPGWTLTKNERDELTKFMYHQIGQEYDTVGAFQSATIFPLEYRGVNRFCSDLGDDGLQRVGRMPVGKSKGYTPSRLAKVLVEYGKYEEPVLIKRAA